MTYYNTSLRPAAVSFQWKRRGGHGESMKKREEGKMKEANHHKKSNMKVKRELGIRGTVDGWEWGAGR